MAKIFGIEGGSQVPSLSQAIQPTLDIPLMEFDSIASALDSYAAFEENDIANAEENFNNITEFHDKLIGEKFDTERQRDVFEKARKDVGIDDNAFRVSLNDLRYSYKMRSMRSKVGQIYERSDVQEVFHEQKRSKDYLEKIYQLKDMNPSLYKKALAKYNQYRNGQESGFNLLPQEFQPIDVTSTIAESLKLVPQIETSDIQTKSGLAYEQIVKERSRTAIDSVINRLNNNAAFKNNLEAMFTDESGNYNKDAANAYVEEMASEYAKQYIDIENVHQMKAPTKPEDQPLQNVMDDVIRLGGDANELMKNKTILQQAVEAEKIIKIDEDDDNVTVHFLNGAGVEDSINIPKTGVSKDAPAQYSAQVGANKKTLNSTDVKDYLEANPKVKKQGWLGLGGDSENEGNDTKGYFKDGFFVTNDVGMLYDMGLVKEGVDSEKIGNYGYTREQQDDGEVLFKVPVTSIKAKTNIDQKPYIPNREDLEGKLENNWFISQKYPKGSEGHDLALTFLASPELQEGFWDEVYLGGIHKGYMEKVESVAKPKENGDYDISKVNSKIKPYLQTNAAIKLKYLAHHHSNASGGFLKDGYAKIEGNSDADAELFAAWKRIDSIMAKNPDMEFKQVLEEVESSGKSGGYSAVYQGEHKSSAIGKHQVLLDSHYKALKEYILANPDKWAKDMKANNQAAQDTVPETETDTTAPPETKNPFSGKSKQ